VAVSPGLSSPAVSFRRGGRIVLGADRGMGVWLFARYRLGWSPVPAAFADVHDGEREKLDRLGRSAVDLHTIARELEQKQTRISIGGAIHDPTDPPASCSTGCSR